MKEVFLALLLFPLLCFSQKKQENIQEINGLPTKEVYDVFVDSKGFLWIGHELGLSRFDGHTFTHFTNNESQSLSVFDIVEDKQGKIWCHNFAGQLFYVVNEKMIFYKAFDHKAEQNFGRMVLIGNQVILSSEKGLFVCETSTLKGNYIKCIGNPQAKTFSVSVLNNVAVARNETDYFIYNPANNSHFRKVKITNNVEINKAFNFIGVTNINSPYLADNKQRMLLRLAPDGQQLKIADTLILKDYINGISSINNTRWVHTKAKSISEKNEVIEGCNLTDITEDKEGNRWMSSLGRGLLVSYKKHWIKYPLPLNTTDFVRRLVKTPNLIIYGTQEGHLLFEERATKKIVFNQSFQANHGSIEYLKLLSPGFLLVGSSGYPFVFDINKKEIVKNKRLDYTIKDADTTDSLLVIATSKGLFKLVIKNLFTNKIDTGQAIFLQRSSSINYDPINKIFLAAAKNGLLKIKGDSITPVLYNNRPIYASGVKFYKNKFFVSSYISGLFIITANSISNLNTQQGLTTNNLLLAKLSEKKLWLAGPSTINVVDAENDRILSNIIIPNLPSVKIFDICEIGKEVFIASPDGLFYTPVLSETGKVPLETHLLKTVVNDSTVITSSKAVLPFHQNNIEFYLTCPFFSEGGRIYFKYRLLGSNKQNWTTIENNLNIVRFSSLMPGKYKFEAIAVHSQLGEAGRKVVYEFSISEPWYKQWWFMVLLTVAALVLILITYKLRIRRLLREERLRRKISVDLHDDIGSTLSTINIYSELARKEKNYIPYILTIQENTREIISKLDDLVWNINPKNDSVSALLEKLKSVAFGILPAKGIICDFMLEKNDYHFKLSANTRQNVFLAFKEIVNNVVKHSDCTECKIKINKKGRHIFITVNDNGKGMVVDDVPLDRNGLQNLTIRAKEVKGVFSITSKPDDGTKIIFSFLLS